MLYTLLGHVSFCFSLSIKKKKKKGEAAVGEWIA